MTSIAHIGLIGSPWLVPIPIPTDTLWQKLKAPFTVPRFCLGKDFYYYNSDNMLCKIPSAFIAYEKDGVLHYRLKDNYFDSDGKSYPFFVRCFLSPVGIGLVEGLIHDFNYRYRCHVRADGRIALSGMTRKQCDRELFNVGMQGNGIFSSSAVAYGILRLFGGFAWRKHRTGDHTERNNPFLLSVGGTGSLPVIIPS